MADDAMASPLVILGAGGLGREVLGVVEAINAAHSSPFWDLLGFLDDDAKVHGRTLCEKPVLGSVEWLKDHRFNEPIAAVPSVGDAHVRAALLRQTEQLGGRVPTLIHPQASLSRFSRVGKGTVICGESCITPDATIGDGVFVNMSCTLGHDDMIGSFVTFGPGVNVCGSVRVGEYTFLGAGSVLVNGITVGVNVMVCAGAVVAHDVPDNVVVAGNPAVVVKRKGKRSS
jgi:sugar O-acyltransferase (sialic acid O-acetyltransferase NeuD family)